MKVSVLAWSDIFNDYVENDLPIDEIKDGTYALFPLGDMSKVYGGEDGDKPINYYVKYYVKINKGE